VRLLVHRIDVRMHGLEVRLWPKALAELVRKVAGSKNRTRTDSVRESRRRAAVKSS